MNSRPKKQTGIQGNISLFSEKRQCAFLDGGGGYLNQYGIFIRCAHTEEG